MINNYRLRWAFYYADHKAPRLGLYDSAGQGPKDSAYACSKENLLTACIEGKHEKTKQIVRLAECAGEDFVNFQWIATAKLAAGNTYQPIIGLMIVSRDEKIQVFRSGQIQRYKHNIDYGKVHLTGFGR